MKKVLSIILIVLCGLLFGCSAQVNVHESSSNDIKKDETDIQIEAVEMTSESFSETVKLFDFNECNVVEKDGKWLYINSDGVIVGECFGYINPDTYLVDIDGDGADELVCNCINMGDGVRRVFVYRYNDGVVECGTWDLQLVCSELGISGSETRPSSTYYSQEDNDVIIEISYMNKSEDETINVYDEVYHIGFDTFVFDKYEYQEE